MKDKFDKLGSFTRAVGAARMLLKRAHEGQFLIEGLVLYASLIDAFCRIALVLKTQLATKSADFDLRYVYQENDKDYFSERAIYKMALDEHIIDNDLFDEIGALYDFRNKVIHRFFISEIEYSHINIVLDRYELIFQRLYSIVYELESQQVHRGVGMTMSGKVEEEDKKRVIAEVLKKIDSQDIDIFKKVLGDKLVKDAASFSEKSERARIVEEIEEEREIQEEKAVIPPGFASVKEITTWARRRGYFHECTCGHVKILHMDSTTGRDKHCGVDGCGCETFVAGPEVPR